VVGGRVRGGEYYVGASAKTVGVNVYVNGSVNLNASGRACVDGSGVGAGVYRKDVNVSIPLTVNSNAVAPSPRLLLPHSHPH
jgi:archaellum component FlaF (FlaF/FlaG flagellin family)